MVAAEVLTQWRRLKVKIHRKKAVRVRSGFPAKVRWNDESEEADLVIIAVGFGLENGVASGGSNSYWSNDSLNQSHLGRSYPAKILVSGYGDGGLIDVIRATITEFNHIDFTHNLISDPETYEKLRLCAKAVLESNANWNEIDFPASVLVSLKEARRPDVDVYFNAADNWFQSKTSSVFNRLIVAMLRKNKDIKFWLGEIKREEIAYQDGFFQVPTMLKNKNKIFKADHVVLRHGTDKECPKLLLSPVWKSTAKKWSAEIKNPASDVSAKSHFNDGYLLDRFMIFKGELEYEVVYLCPSQEQANDLLRQIKGSANNRKRVKGEIFRLGDHPEFLPNRDWHPSEKVLSFKAALFE